jgi:hypothetical protein
MHACNMRVQCPYMHERPYYADDGRRRGGQHWQDVDAECLCYADRRGLPWRWTAALLVLDSFRLAFENHVNSALSLFVANYMFYRKATHIPACRKQRIMTSPRHVLNSCGHASPSQRPRISEFLTESNLFTIHYIIALFSKNVHMSPTKLYTSLKYWF